MANQNCQNYVSCIKVDGKPILPPVMNDERRLNMQQLREQAIAVEAKLREKKRAQLMEQIRNILDHCVTRKQLPPTRAGQSRHPPSLISSPMKIKISHPDASDVHVPATSSFSLPTTPTKYDDAALTGLHLQFLAMKKNVPQDVSISDTSALSTDLGPYMEADDTDSCASDSSTPHILTDADISSPDCSTHNTKSPSRVRRLSYTLEAPSPVLLKHLMINRNATQGELMEPSVPKLDLYDDDSVVIPKSGKKSSTPRHSNSTNGHAPPCSISLTETTTPIKVAESDANQVNSNHHNLKRKSLIRDDFDSLLANGNDYADESINEKNQRQDKNGNHREANNSNQSHKGSANPNLIEEFLQQQQQLMKELLEQQALEQEKLINMFREQEQQLVVQLHVQQQTSRSSGDSKSPACRNLNRSFERAARARRLFDSGRLSALVRGYLTRRLLATDRVQAILQTIRDTTTCLKELNQGSLTILPSDVELHRRLIQQLNGAISAFHEVFTHWGVSERMLAIRRDREKKALMVTGRGMPVQMRSRSRSLSSATQKSLSRKQSTNSTTSHYRHQQQDSSRPSSASTMPRTSPSSFASSSSYHIRRSPTSSLSSYSAAAQSNYSAGSLHGRKQQQQLPAVKGRKPWRC